MMKKRWMHKGEDEEETIDEGEDEEETLEEGEEEELDEAAKSRLIDIDIDGDGDKEESMKDEEGDC